MTAGESDQRTIVACLTPPGAGAIATLGIRGPRAWAIARELFRSFSASFPELPRKGDFWLGRLGDEAADEVVLAVKRVTPVPWLEIHCHGGTEVVRFLIDTLQRRGLEVGTWTDLDDSSASRALMQALTVRTAAILLDQVNGALAQEISAIRDSCDRRDTDDAARRLETLAKRAPIGRHLTNPWKVAVLGAPNVGKSSLVNALAGFQRSIVAPTPGTTRDVVSTLVAVDGWPVELFDTAGMRESGEVIEEEGIARARLAAAQADLCLWVLDGSAPPVWPDVAAKSTLFVVNKSDLPPAWEWGHDKLAVSALAGTGLGELCDAISRRLVPEAPPTGAAVPFTEQQCVDIVGALASVRRNECAEAARMLAAHAASR
jgi:tRNA modification GTPase